MTDQPAIAATATATVAHPEPERLHYAASGARKTMMSIIFVLLLPFFVSLPIMLATRMSHGLWRDTVGLGVLALAFTAIMSIFLLQLMFAIRGRVTIGKNAVALNLPQGRSPTPKLSYVNKVIPFDQVLRVETRREVYGAPLAPVVMQGARIVTKDDGTISLGYVSDKDLDTFPVLTIAQNIADRAGIKVVDEGILRRSIRSKISGIKHSEAQSCPLCAEEIETLNWQHKRMMLAIIGFLAALLATGIYLDIAKLVT